MNQTHQSIIEKISEFDTIIIHRHVNPDPDALGSQGGLQNVILNSFPEKQVFVVGEEVEGLKFLNCMDTISDEMYENALVIVCDTANEERISDKRYQLGKYLIKIDHHPNREPYGNLEWVDETFSSASEMIMDLVNSSFNVLQLNDLAAQLLYAGIVGDTGRFLYNNTKSRTLQIASQLFRYNINPQDIYNQFYRTTKEVAKFQGYVLQNFKVTAKGVASLYISKELMKEFRVSQVDAANLVNTLANIDGNNIWVFFVEYDEEVRVRIRSKETTINEVARQFDGGGHPLASGATVYSISESQELVKALDELL